MSADLTAAYAEVLADYLRRNYYAHKTVDEQATEMAAALVAHEIPDDAHRLRKIRAWVAENQHHHGGFADAVGDVEDIIEETP